MHDRLIDQSQVPGLVPADLIFSDCVPWQGLECNEFTD